MCIIATKPAGIELFSNETLRNMFENNRNGSGYMFTRDGQVFIRKGFMTFDSFLSSITCIQDVKNLPMIFHFRITTHGGTSKQNCHPFPVSGKLTALQALKTTCDLGMVHNGVIHSVTPRKGISDTMEYILDIVDPLRRLSDMFYLQKEGKKVLETTAQSKLAFLDGEGRITTVGEFIEKDGCLFSNTSYEKREPVKYSYDRKSYGYGYGSHSYGYQHTYFDNDSDYDDTDEYYERLANSIVNKPKVLEFKPTDSVYLMRVPEGCFATTTDDQTTIYELDEKIHAIDTNSHVYEIFDDGTAMRITDLDGLNVYDLSCNRLRFEFSTMNKYTLAKEEVKK